MHAFDWTVEDSTHVFQSRWLSVRADRCRMPNGHVIDPYYVIEHPAWVTVVAVTPRNEIVLVRQYRHGLRKTVSGLPAGCVETHDASPEEAITRELREETGYVADEIIEIGRLSAGAALHANITYCFLGLAARRVGSPSPEESEQLETVVMPIERVLHLISQGHICQALHVSAIFLALHRLKRLDYAFE
jgi:8-oxo-dGTP pyrophosphatase MutT (NUDIX family)